ncbi:ureidoglycolate hydrolase [Bombardia bombarda]|uniref:Ureidoglycolate hydrolase n=1 Tax=Bombardia bombarda TaxID=252184 RepID=A0AA39WGJ0_9PEZI|nr:ureidoglycolate hydrolase [Bombardia bombarda]
MAKRVTVQLEGRSILIDAVPLSREAFAPFGDVVENPRQDLHPSVAATATATHTKLPFDAIVANQGTAIKYPHVTRMENYYDQAPSGRPGVAVMNMFVCAARSLLRASHSLEDDMDNMDNMDMDMDMFPVAVLERHPFTAQTFIPLTADPTKHFLVVVAPSLPSNADPELLLLPVPNSRPADSAVKRPLPGQGLPDVHRLRAFVATTEQAVTYGAGTWHAPMVALGSAGTAVDFLVVQFANEVAVEDSLRQLSSPNSMASALESTDARNKLEDLSGVKIRPGENPYDALINACSGRPAEIQSLYSTHRVTRNSQQRDKFLSPDFKELIIDPFLLRLERPEIEPGFQDPRYCLVFWARPPEHIIKLASHLQGLLKKASPDIWLMPPQRMHMTALELAHSLTPPEIDALTTAIRPALTDITNLTYSNRARLVKPFISYDLSAFAVSFLPAAGEPVTSPPPVPPHPGHIAHPGLPDGSGGTSATDVYSYHHLRRDVFNLAKAAGVEVASRYVVPSAHITLGRYLGQDDHDTVEKRERWVKAIDQVNKWLEDEVWDMGREPVEGTEKWIGEWIVGQERGLDARSGQLWYGGGRTIMMGEGF